MWLEINTAPRDGSEILIWLTSPFSRVEKVRWFNIWKCWIVGDLPNNLEVEQYGVGSKIPTHWQPLPAPPA